LSGDKISIQMLQKLYRHSSITTTIGYQSSFIHKDADDALGAVLGMCRGVGFNVHKRAVEIGEGFG
jgi:hypothetical protein